MAPLMSAPRSRSSLTVDTWRRVAAMIRGVTPWGSASSMSAPLSSRRRTASSCPLLAAFSSALRPSNGMTALMSTPCAMRVFIVSRSPASAARMSRWLRASFSGSGTGKVAAAPAALSTATTPRGRALSPRPALSGPRTRIRSP